MATTTDSDRVSETNPLPSRERIPWWALAMVGVVLLGWVLNFLFNGWHAGRVGDTPPTESRVTGGP